MMNNFFRLRTATLASVLVLACHLPAAHAEMASVEVQPGDTLSRIVASQYPGYRNRLAIMQFVLEQNPQAFIGNDLNRLIVGKTLQLPDAASIPAAEPPPPPPAPAQTEGQDETRQALQARLEALETENNGLKDQLGGQVRTLEANKKQLQDQLASLEADKKQLQDQLASLGTDKKQFQDQLATLEADKKQLQNQLATLETEKQQNSEKVSALETEKQQQTQQIATLEAKIAELGTASETAMTPPPADSETTGTAAPTEDAIAQAEADREILIQQLDAIESANTQIQAEKETLQKERDQLSTQLSQLETDKKQLTGQLAALETQVADLTAASDAAMQAPAADGEAPPDEMLAQGDDDREILIQQLDAVESANTQIQAEKEALQKELDTAKQQLGNAAADTEAMAALKLDLGKAQEELVLAKAAQANAELTKANLEKNAAPLWPWLLALLLLPVAWFLGRKSQPATNPAAAPAVTPVQAASAAPPPPPQELDSGLSPDSVEETVVGLPRMEPATALSGGYPSSAANDDSPDAAIKLDIVRAYLDLRDPQSAQSILNEILHEGGRQQRQEAREIMSFLS